MSIVCIWLIEKQMSCVYTNKSYDAVYVDVKATFKEVCLIWCANHSMLKVAH